jgi:enoyl-CoA hydratase/carnithine racemase
MRSYLKGTDIAFIKLNRPERLNAINREMRDYLVQSCIRLRDDESLWVGIVSGEGRAFYFGADVREVERGHVNADPSLFGPPKSSACEPAIWRFKVPLHLLNILPHPCGTHRIPLRLSRHL